MSIYLIDTSAWVDFFRNAKSDLTKYLDSLLESNQVCSMDIIIAEILSGANNDREYKHLKDYLSALPQIQEPENVWEKAGYYRYHLTRRGFQIPIVDLYIGITAEFNNRIIVTKDKHFEKIKSVIGVKIEFWS